MRNLWLITIILMICSCQTQAQMAEKESNVVKAVVKAYAAAGDARQVDELASHLDPAYRIALNDLEKAEVSIVDRATYLNLIETKVFGGDKRTLTFEQVDLYQENMATVKVKMAGEKATFFNYLSLAKVNGNWTIVQDMVMIGAP